MGGATSKLNETDWEKADGKLRNDSETVDGAPPTSEYGIYYLTKKGVNQREFEITDSESNLIYTTKQVPGTIACFDVLGKEMDSHLLRITVDIARRYWTIYKFEEPIFLDQKPDKEATEKLVAERLQVAEADPKVENFNTPFMFRKAVIVVSWSRYMAVSVFYGPPSEDMVKQWEERQIAKQKEDEEKKRLKQQEDDKKEQRKGEKGEQKAGAVKKGLIFTPTAEVDEMDDGENDTTTDNKEFKCNVPRRPIVVPTSGDSAYDDEDDDGDEDEGSFLGMERTTSVELEDVDVNNDKDDSTSDSPHRKRTSSSDMQHWLQSSSSAASVASSSTSNTKQSTSESGKQSDTTTKKKGRRRRTFRTWAKQKSQHLREKSRSALESSGIISNIADRDPMEGILHLDQPLLLCQEIYTRIIGNHQTSRITKEAALQLLKQDIAQHEKDDPDSAKQPAHETDEQFMTMTGQEVILRTESENSGDGEPEQKSAEPEDMENEKKSTAPNSPSAETRKENKQDSTLSKEDDEKKDAKEGDLPADQFETTVKNNGGQENDKKGGEEKSESAEKTEDGKESDSAQQEEEEKEQELVGYWLWENTLRTHKMKMHVAKGADLAMHVILAIIVNQVRYERNALAMTI